MQKRGQKSWNSLEGLQKIHMTYSHSPLPGSRLILTRMLTRKKKSLGQKLTKITVWARTTTSQVHEWDIP